MRKSLLIVFGIFIIAITIRLYFAFQTPYFADTESYFHLRQIEHIKESGLPLFKDNLSYGGRTYVFLPFFHYLIAFFTLFSPVLFIAKIIPAILASFSILLVYLIAKKITNLEEVSVISAFIAAFIPIYFKETINILSIYSLAIPLSLLLIYFYLTVNAKGYAILLTGTLLLFLLTKPTIMIMILSFIVYIIFIKIENLPIEREETEIVLFSVILSLWFYLLLYKNAFLTHSYAFLWHNVPLKYFTSYFNQISIMEAIYQIGIIPFFAGIYCTYKYVFKKREKAMYLLISVVITTTLLMWLQLIELNVALIYLSFFMILLFAKILADFLKYLQETKFNRYKPVILSILIVIFLLSSVLPSLVYANQNLQTNTKQNEINALLYLYANTEQDATILASLHDGHMIAYFANRKTVADDNFMLIDNINERVTDIDTLFTTYSKIKAAEILDKYSVDYIMLSDQVKKEYSLTDLRFIDDQCFEKSVIYNVTIYKNKCKLVTSN